jgi:hypothetical protein
MGRGGPGVPTAQGSRRGPVAATVLPLRGSPGPNNNNNICDVTGTQGSGIPEGIGADSGKFRLWTGIPGIRDCRRGVPLGRY